MDISKINFLIINIFISALLFLYSCRDTNDTKIKKEYYDDGNLKLSAEMLNGKRNGICIFYYEDGNIKSLEKYVNDTLNGEIFAFFPTGVLEKKTIMAKGVQDGPFYSFYPNGSIKEFRKWQNGKKEGYGEDYWDKDENIRAIYFSKNDTLVYQRRFDTSGIVIKTEGNVPQEPNKKVN